MDELLKGLEDLSVPETFRDRLSHFSFNLFRKGIVAPLIDTYIALLCIENDAWLLRRDKHFDLIAQRSPLKVVKTPDSEIRIDFQS